MLQRPAGAPGLLLDAGPQPAGECRGLLGEPHAQQRVDGEGGIPDPGESVVPVALTTDLLREPRRRRRHQAPGRRVGHQLQRDRRALEHLPPSSGVGGLRQPGPPEADGFVHQLLSLRHPHLARRTIGIRLEDQAAHLSGFQGKRGVNAVARGRRHQPDVIGLAHEVEGQRRTLALEDRTVLRHVQRVGLPSVVEPRRDVEVEAHPAADDSGRSSRSGGSSPRWRPSPA